MGRGTKRFYPFQLQLTPFGNGLVSNASNTFHISWKCFKCVHCFPLWIFSLIRIRVKLGNLVMGDFVSFLLDRYESFPRWIGVNYGNVWTSRGRTKKNRNGVESSELRIILFERGGKENFREQCRVRIERVCKSILQYKGKYSRLILFG